MIYIILFIILLIFSWRYDYFKLTSYKKLSYNTALFLLILIAGFRYRTGADTLSYMNEFEFMPSLIDIQFSDFFLLGREPLWVLLISSLKLIWKEFYIVQLVLAIFVNVVIFKFFKKNTTYYFTAIFFYYTLFYLYFNMEILRESIAICIFLISVKYLINKENIKFYLCMLIASGFHYGALFLFSFPLLYKFKFNGYSVVFTFIVLTLFYFIGYDFILEHLPLNEILKYKLLYYKINTLNINGILFRIIAVVIFPLLCYYILVHFYKFKNDYNGLAFIYFFVSSLTVFFPGLYRLLNYFSIIIVIYISYISVNFFLKKEPFRKLFALVVTNVVIISNLLTITQDTSEFIHGTRYYIIWYPYSSILNEKVYPERERIRMEQMTEQARKRSVE